MTTDAVNYSMRISRLTVEKLGVKLYDRVSAVIAELIANAYDADARKVTVCAPTGLFLASKADGQLRDKGFSIEIKDDGTGMTPKEAQDFFLVVGADRRRDLHRGSESRVLKRKVMGRKGVGKLAPFGICKIIEVVSAGGDKIKRKNEEGYLTSHFILNYDDIVAVGKEPDKRYEPEVGPLDNTLSSATGTTITLRNFAYRKVPNTDRLARQIAQRFGIQSADWKIFVVDNTQPNGVPCPVDKFHIQTMPNTRLTLEPDEKVIGPDGEQLSEIKAGFEYEGTFRHLTGWMAYSKDPYKDDLMAGVRIYCRGKIAAQTSLFNRGAGFTGEHSIRSYLVGELHANWLDEEEDLIQTDRRDILWSDELASAFQDWGQRMVKHIGKLSRDPMRKVALDTFFEVGHVEDRIQESYPSENQKEIRETAINVAKAFGKSISRSEAEKNEEAVKNLVDLSITLAPHVTLDEKMRKAVEDSNTPLEALNSFLRTARIAELSSFGRIAEDRLKVIHRLEELKDEDSTNEGSLQNLIEDAPWLINPEWAPVTANQSLSSLRKEFEEYYRRVRGKRIHLSDFSRPRKRPDFVLSTQEGTAQIVEIKRPQHALTDLEMERIIDYDECMQSFFNDPVNADFKRYFNGFHITLVCDDLKLSPVFRRALDGIRGRFTHINWKNFLLRTRMVHQDFLREAQRLMTMTGEIS